MSDATRNAETIETARIDRWLWAARFFKTRSLAHRAINGGKVTRNGRRAKPSNRVHVGDRIAVTKGEARFELDVAGVSEKRGPASKAQALYVETAGSVARRQREAEERRAAHAAMPRPARRPDKKQRRQLRDFKQNG